MLNQSAFKFIESEFNQRKSKNPNYSLRAYAKNLGVSPGVLSQILNGKKEVTPKVLKIIAPKLNLDEDTYSKLLEKQSKIKKENSIKSLDKNDMRLVDMETFSIISDWYHFAILELFNLDYYECNANWIAKKLDITVEQASNAIDSLLKVKLLENNNGQLSPSNSFTAIVDYPYTSQAMRERQKQLLKLSSEKIDSLNTAVRDHSAITICVDLSLLPEIKDKIKAFRRSLGNFIAKNSKESNAIYEMQISLFPVSTLDDMNDKMVN